MPWRWTMSLVAYGVLAVIALVFAHGALEGDRGLAALAEAEARHDRLNAELAALRSERDRLADKVARLRTDNLDLDLLDERARTILGHARPDEVLIRP